MSNKHAMNPMNPCCLFDGSPMHREDGYYSVDGPQLYGTYIEFTCPICGHKVWYGGFTQDDWAEGPLTGCKCGVCSLQSEVVTGRY